MREFRPKSANPPARRAGTSLAGTLGAAAWGAAALGAAAAMLSGCASGDGERALAARQSLVGMPKDMLLACTGVPDKTSGSEGREYLGYVSQSPRPTGTGVSIGLGGFSGNFGGGIGVPLSRPSIETCEATFVLDGGRVTQVSYRGGGGGSEAPLDQCWRIVANCADGG